MIKFSVRQKTNSIHFVFNDNKRKLTRSLRTTAATTNRFETKYSNENKINTK